MIWISPGTNQDCPDHNDPATCTAKPLSDRATDKCFPGFRHRDIAGWPIAAPVQPFFFMNTPNTLEAFMITALVATKLLKSVVHDVVAQKVVYDVVALIS